MRKTFIFLTILALGVALTGCEDDNDVVRYIEVDEAPPAPQGVYSITGDEAVYIYWLPVRDDDLDYYGIYWNDEPTGEFELIGTSSDESYIDYDVENGVTYYYAVTAVDVNGNESELSYENVYDTPRPERFDQSLYDFLVYPDDAGFDFSSGSVVTHNSLAADIYIDYDIGLQAFFINARDKDTDLQDMGYTQDFDEIGYAPAEGWSFVGWVEVIVGHTYVIWTRDDHFAKMRVTAADYENNDNIVFDWAYQTASADPGRMELARPEHDENYLKYEVDTKDMKLIR
jgi:hypothetical protein